MILNDIEFDEDGYSLSEYDEKKEGKRTVTSEIWVDSYVTEPNAKGDQMLRNYCARLITCNNYGTCTIDGKTIKDPKQIEWVRNFFKMIKESL